MLKLDSSQRLFAATLAAAAFVGFAPTPAAAQSYRNYGSDRIHTPEMVREARAAARAAYRQCLRDNFQNDLRNRAVNAGAQIAGQLANRLLNGRSYGSYGGYYSGSYNNSWRCDNIEREVYQDMLSAQPERYSFCEERLSTRIRRGGDYAEEPVADRNCVSRSPSDWQAEFTPTAASQVRPYPRAASTTVENSPTELSERWTADE